jgi:glutamyl-tRNA synthetase
MNVEDPRYRSKLHDAFFEAAAQRGPFSQEPAGVAEYTPEASAAAPHGTSDASSAAAAQAMMSALSALPAGEREALGAALPKFGHVPMILGSDGERLSKRHGAVSVMQYRDDGFLPEAMINYLARLGWSHGDNEKFSREQLVEWFDLAHVSKSPARFDPDKLLWLNQQYMREAETPRLADLVLPFLAADGCSTTGGPALPAVIDLLRQRASSLHELADAAAFFYRPLHATTALREQHYTPEARPALQDLHTRLQAVAWERAAINDVIKAVVGSHALKMPKLAMPLRVMVTGSAQTPSIDATLELIGRETVLSRMAAELALFPG